VKSKKMDAPFESNEWEVPCTPTSKAKIRVSDSYGPDYDVIINSFSILCESESSKKTTIQAWIVNTILPVHLGR
jgi:hypothetical protein